MQLIKDADVVLCLGTRLNPFSTLPGYGLDYWPSDAKIIQVDINPDRIGLTKKVSIGIVGDAGKVANDILAQLSDTAGDLNRDTRKVKIAETKSKWAQQLSSMDHEDDDPGTTWNQRARADKPAFALRKFLLRGHLTGVWVLVAGVWCGDVKLGAEHGFQLELAFLAVACMAN